MPTAEFGIGEPPLLRRRRLLPPFWPLLPTCGPNVPLPALVYHAPTGELPQPMKLASVCARMSSFWQELACRSSCRSRQCASSRAGWTYIGGRGATFPPLYDTR
eukprot:5238316-Prymnesium_polylepis.1